MADPYRYEVEPHVIIAADGLDSAWRKAQALVAALEECDGVVEASVSMLDLHHRPDLDGSLRT